MTTTTKSGYVIGSDEKIYVQVPAKNQHGFSICDEDQSWEGGIGSGLKSWTLLGSDDARITQTDRERLGWILDQHADETDGEFSITWEFIGRASQQHFDVAQAVADAMVAMESPVVTPKVVKRACEQLGDGWDPSSVYAYIENCSFTTNEEAESA